MRKDEAMNGNYKMQKVWGKVLVGALFVITFSTKIQPADGFSYGVGVGNPFEQAVMPSMVLPAASALDIKAPAQSTGNADVLLTRFGIDLSKFKLGWFGGWSDFDAAVINKDDAGNPIAAEIIADQKRLEKLKFDRLKELWTEYMQAFKNDLQGASAALMDDVKALDKRRTETKNKDLQSKYAYFVELALQVKNQMDLAIMNAQVEKIMKEISPLQGVMLSEGFRQVEFNLGLAKKVGNQELFNVYDRVRKLLFIIENECIEIKKSVSSIDKALKKAEEDLRNTERAKSMAFKSTQYDNHILLYRQVIAQLNLEISAVKKQSVEKAAFETKIKNDAKQWFDKDLKTMEIGKAFAIVRNRLDQATQKNDLFVVGVCENALDLLASLELEQQIVADKLRVEQEMFEAKVVAKADEMIAKYGSLKMARQKSQESLKKSSDPRQREFIVQVINLIQAREAADPFNQSVAAATSIKSVAEVPTVLGDLLTSTLSLAGVNRSKLTQEQNDKIDELLKTYALRLQDKVKNPSENPKETETLILQEFSLQVTSVITGIDTDILASKDPKRIAVSGATSMLLNWMTKPSKKESSSDF
jgi:hypothetical protein